MIGFFLWLCGSFNPGAMLRSRRRVEDISDEGCQLFEEVRFLVLEGKQSSLREFIFLGRLRKVVQHQGQEAPFLPVQFLIVEGQSFDNF